MKDRKPFKQTKLFGILKGVAEVAIDILPIPDPRKYFDKNQDGKVDVTDLSKIKWTELVTAVGLCAAMLYFEIIDYNTLIGLIKAFIN